MKQLPLLALCVGILFSSAAFAGPLRDRFQRENSQSNLSLRENTQKMEMFSLNHGGLERTYGLFVPNRVARSRERAPLVIMLHGGGGFAENANKMTGWSDKAAREGFIVAYPEGTGKFKDKLFTWNSLHCCGYAMKNSIDDVGFISTLIDTLITTHRVDPRRVYVTGLSNGGMMAHIVGAALPDKVAAIAPVISGLRGDEPAPKGPVSTIIINGALDESVPPAGGVQGKKGTKFDDDTLLLPANYQGDLWAKANGCSPTPKYINTPPIEQWLYDCPAGQHVTRYLVGDNGHAWPSGERGSPMGDTPSTSMNATNVIWDFFKAHSK